MSAYHTPSACTIINTPHHCGTFVKQSISQHWHIIINQSLYIRVDFLCCISVSFDKRVMICTHLSSSVQGSFTALQSLCAPPSHLSLFLNLFHWVLNSVVLLLFLNETKCWCIRSSSLTNQKRWYSLFKKGSTQTLIANSFIYGCHHISAGVINLLTALVFLFSGTLIRVESTSYRAKCHLAINHTCQPQSIFKEPRQVKLSSL